jgi:hypothetical protein
MMSNVLLTLLLRQWAWTVSLPVEVSIVMANDCCTKRSGAIDSTKAVGANVKGSSVAHTRVLPTQHASCHPESVKLGMVSTSGK